MNIWSNLYLIANFFIRAAAALEDAHFPIHARSSHAIIPSTTARNVVTMNRLRRVNRGGHRSRKTMASEPLASTRNQYGTISLNAIGAYNVENPKTARFDCRFDPFPADLTIANYWGDSSYS